MSKKNRQDSQKPAMQAGSAGNRFADYFWANVIFFAFLTILAYMVWVNCQAPTDPHDPAIRMVLDDTFQFMICLFGGGFLVVTMFDAAYDFFAERAESEASDESQ